MSYERVQAAELELQTQIDAPLARAAQIDVAEADQPELDIPGEIARREQRIEAIAAAKLRLEERQRQTDAQRGRKPDDDEPPDDKPRKRGRALQRAFAVPSPNAQDNFRDAGEIAALAMPAFHQRPSAPTNLTLHQAMDINVPIGCGDAPVFPGDVVVGDDDDGMIIVSLAWAREIADEALQMTEFEVLVMERVRGGRSILGLYPATDEVTRIDFNVWRRGRLRC